MTERSSRIRRIACVGGGTIGRSWGTLFAGKGYDVIVEDQEKDALSLARKMINSNFVDLVSSGLVSKESAKSSLTRVTYTRNLEDAVQDADYVQESVPESLPLKRRIFAKISSMAPSHSVIASSTGGFFMSKIQSVASNPGRCVVVHPCQLPVHLTPLVEIVPGKTTTRQTVEITERLMCRIGKKPIVLKHEIPDYIMNRLQFTLLREAIDMVGRGIVSAADVDAVLCEVAETSRCIGLGPFLEAEMHGGPHGLGGVGACMRYYAKVLPDTWRSLTKWTRVPEARIVGVERSVRKLVRERGMSTRELVRWRDRNLITVARRVWSKSR